MPRFAAAIDTSGIPVKTLRPDTTGTTPSSPNEGQLWADSTLHQLKYWNGTAWVQLDNVAGGTASNVTDGDKGDLTVASGIWTLDTGVVNSAKIADGTVALGDLAFTPIVSGGAAGGDLTGTYPNPTIGVGKVTSSNILDATITDTDVATANKDGIATTPSMRTLGTSSTSAAAGNDSRLSDSRAPNGSAGGDLAGSTYPNPTIAGGAVTLSKMAANSVDSSKIVDGSITDTDVNAANKDGAVGVASMRTIGTGALQALAGNTRLDTITAPTGAVSLNSQRITNLLDPVNPQEAATKNYVDLTAQGLDPKQSVRAATTVNISNLATSAPSTLDGVSLAANDRVLVKDQTTTATNGIYTVTTVGTGANGVWARATDMDAWAEVPSAFTFVEEGTAAADTGWVCTSNTGGTLNTTAITWVQFTGASQIIDGAALLKTGNTLDVRVDNTTIEVTTDQLNVKALGIGTAQLAAGAVNLTSKVTGTLPLANGGTGGTDAATARTSLGVPGLYNQVLGALTSGVYVTVTHSLNIAGTPIVSVLEVASGEEIILDWKKTSANAIQVKADLAFSASALSIVVTG